MLKSKKSNKSPSPVADDRLRLRSKFITLLRRHDQLKQSFYQLESQIKFGLREAEEVVTSLAIPLMQLVGLKTEEMAEQGRFSSIIINSSDAPDYRRTGEGVASDTRTSSTVVREQHSNGEVLNCATKASMVGRDLVEKQHSRVTHLVQLLKQIEKQVNSKQCNILELLAEHQLSLQKLFQKAVYCLSSLQCRNTDVMKLLQSLFTYMSSILSSVENGVEELMQSLANQMCNPMVNYVKSLKEDLKCGTFMRLLETVEDVENESRHAWHELVEARKRARVAEEEKVEALNQLREMQEMMKRLNGLLDPPSVNKRQSIESSAQYLTTEEDRYLDDKLMWDLLKKRRNQTPESPMGPPKLLSSEPSRKQSKSLGTWNHRCGLLLMGPNARIPLGASPSATVKHVVSRKRSIA